MDPRSYIENELAKASGYYDNITLINNAGVIILTDKNLILWGTRATSTDLQNTVTGVTDVCISLDVNEIYSIKLATGTFAPVGAGGRMMEVASLIIHFPDETCIIFIVPREDAARCISVVNNFNSIPKKDMPIRIQ